MSDKFEQAARIHDPVEHSPSTPLKIVGFFAGVAIGVAIVAGGPITWAAAGTVAMSAGITAGAGSIIGSYMEDYVAGDVETGAATVFVGGARSVAYNAARVTDLCGCHDEPIATGVRNIEIEGELAARAEEETRCAGKLKDNACCPTVWYGGPSARVIDERYNGAEPGWFFWLSTATGLVPGGNAANLPRAMQAVRWALKARSYYRGGPVREHLEYGAAIAGAFGDDRTAKTLNNLAYDLSAQGIVTPREPEIPHLE